MNDLRKGNKESIPPNDPEFPQLVVSETRVKCGYGPRIIQSSLDRNLLFVGCKDGTVTFARIEHPNQAFVLVSPSYPNGPRWGRGVRAICEWEDGWLLVGRYDATLDLFDLRSFRKQLLDAPLVDADQPFLNPEPVLCKHWKIVPPPRLLKAKGFEKFGKVTYLGWMDENRLAVSFRLAGTWIIERDHGGELAIVDTVKKAFRTAWDRNNLEGNVPALGSVATALSDHVGSSVPQNWIFVSQTGRVWRAELRENKVVASEEKSLWRQYEQPGFVTDFAFVQETADSREGDSRELTVQAPDGVRVCHAIYISTDVGVYRLHWHENDTHPSIVPVSLPGVGEMCMAVTYCASPSPDETASTTPSILGKNYLWVSVGGDAHLFWNRRKKDKKKGDIFWHRSGISHDQSQVLRAYAFWKNLRYGEEVRHALIVGQTRRNDEMVISSYTDIKKERGGKKLNLKRLLLGGTWRDLDKFLDKQDMAEASSWRLEAKLAEVFEAVQRDDELRDLIEFLGNPTAELVFSVLDKLAKDRAESRQLDRAIRLWTYALLSTVHRCLGQKRAWGYMGLIRFLRAIGRRSNAECQGLHSGERLRQLKIISQAVESSILFVRKWGVFGDSYSKLTGCINPLSVLLRQHQESQILDRLAYGASLFNERVDLEAEISANYQLGRTAWDLRYLRVGQRRFLVGSWIWGDVKLYEVLSSPSLDWRASYSLVELGSLRSLRQERKAGPPVYGHSRSVCIGRLKGSGDQFYVLVAPAKEAPATTGTYGETDRPAVENDRNEKGIFKLWWQDHECPKRNRLEKSIEFQDLKGEPNFPSIANESVYSLLELEPGRVLAGLRGNKGRARLLLLEVRPRSDQVPADFRLVIELPTASPEGSTITRNPVWCLAKNANGPSNIVFAGCEDGQVWRLKLPLGSNGADRIEYGLVARLGSPVWALGCRMVQSEEKRLASWRIFAGGADGTIIAWQSAHSDIKGSHSRETDTVAWRIDKNKARKLKSLRSDMAIGTLWATSEEGAISRIHPTYTDANRNHPIVLAVTQRGRGILFDDRAEIEKLENSPERPTHQRPEIPGGRFARLKLKSNCFASALIGPDPLLDRDYQAGSPPCAFARLAVATDDGRVRLLGIYYPDHDNHRRGYDGLVQEWWESLRLQGGEESRNQGPFLRQAESTFTASPGLPLILVRQIFPSKRKVKRRLLDAQWIPRHLRPLLQLDRSWTAWKSTDGYLEQALRHAQRLNDRFLFKEIVSVALIRANRDLFEVSGPSLSEHAIDFGEIYGSVLEELDRTCELWLGDEHAYLGVQITRAKNLMDGDALWRLASTTEELKKSEKELSDKDRQRLSAFKRMLSWRVEQVRKLLSKGKSLLELETLRACNLSLLRASHRIISESGRVADKWDPKDPEQELPWPAPERFFDIIGEFAARMFHSQGGLKDAFVQEIARAYALGVCLCPSAAIPIAHSLAEASLPDHVLLRVVQQFAVLGEIGVAPPKLACDLFEMASRKKLDPEERNGDPRKRPQGGFTFQTWKAWFDLEDKDKDDCEAFEKKMVERVGIYNARRMADFIPYDRVIRYFIDLVVRFSGNAGSINLPQAKELTLPKKVTVAFKHTHAFWSAALEDFKTEIGIGELDAPEAEGPVRPEVVLLSSRIADWCEKWIVDLRDRAESHRLFEPERTVWLQVLSRLRTTARAFPHSTAIQQSIVFGVLSHGLLETLDEHILEFDEMACALNPLLAPGQQSIPGFRWQHGQSTHHRFASYLIGRSSSAQSVPKNLRVLQELLSHYRPSQDGEAGKERVSAETSLGVENIFLEVMPEKDYWVIEGKFEIKLSPMESRYLKLTLQELIDNDRTHGRPKGSLDKNKPVLLARPTPDQVERYANEIRRKNRNLIKEADCRILIGFSFEDHATPLWEETRRRLQRLRSAKLQSLFDPDPRKDREIPSHGTGLYLANLAASVVGWRLQITNIEDSRFWMALFRVPS